MEEKTECTILGDQLGKVQYLQLDEVKLQFQKLATNNCYPVDIWIDTPTIHMNFVLSGKRRYLPAPGYGPSNQLAEGHHSLGYYTALRGKLQYAERMPCFTIDIAFSESYLRTLFQDDLSQLKDFGKAIEKRQSALLGNRTFPLTQPQKDVLMAMYDCQLTGQLQKLFIEGKLLELLTLQIGQFQDEQPVRQDLLKREDLEKFHTIRDELAQNLDNPPSLKELTILVGMNRTKLMSGFKEVFGTTIFSYVADLRMERAKELMLSDTYMKVAEVARLVGFKSPNNFSIAFKKKFGFSPNTFR
ncbi:helix-turn-helix transcriptional regulator [Spirosoma sp. BT702]|uniref:Helix-turn-helix transcriptional regulator n=1 Tax=Spirosoma profusum TaxID=2771354 RepID=A0A927ASI7_9BACT|nr:AraC family transcriptional regulator [Spirosoma profusum]MBD2703918.1 helix-turn-helix transcriptional regulator [Spirosoma profusum]